MSTQNTKGMLRVPYALSVHGREEAAAVARVIVEHRTALGRETAEFEKGVAKLFGKKYGVMVNSGSSANLLAFEVLNVPPGSEVITPILNFNTTVSPILQKGLVPVFVDVQPGTYLIDIDQIERKVTKRTRVLIIPSLIGNVPDMARLQKLARRHKLFLIEDSCDTLGATFGGRPTGTFSDISTTSFYGSHVINAAGGGGMICVSNPAWRDRLRMLRGWGRTSALFADSEQFAKRFSRKLVGVPYDGKFIFAEVGYNFLPLEVSAAFGRVQLQKLPRFTQIRRRNFAQLLKYFRRWKQYFELPQQTPGTQTNWLAFPLTMRASAPFSRIEIVKFLEGHNIQTRPVFGGNMLRQPAYAALQRRYALREYPVADSIMRSAFLIGCHHGLTPRHLRYLQGMFEAFLKRYMCAVR